MPRELQTEHEAAKNDGDGKRRVKMSSSAQRAASFVDRSQYGEVISLYRSGTLIAAHKVCSNRESYRQSPRRPKLLLLLD